MAIRNVRDLHNDLSEGFSAIVRWNVIKSEHGGTKTFLPDFFLCFKSIDL